MSPANATGRIPRVPWMLLLAPFAFGLLGLFPLTCATCQYYVVGEPHARWSDVEVSYTTAPALAGIQVATHRSVLRYRGDEVGEYELRFAVRNRGDRALTDLRATARVFGEGCPDTSRTGQPLDGGPLHPREAGLLTVSVAVPGCDAERAEVFISGGASDAARRDLRVYGSWSHGQAHVEIRLNGPLMQLRSVGEEPPSVDSYQVDYGGHDYHFVDLPELWFLDAGDGWVTWLPKPRADAPHRQPERIELYPSF